MRANIMLFYGCLKDAIKGSLILLAFFLIQKFFLPIAPGIFAPLFSVFVNYTRRMLPCIFAGILIVKKCSMREFVAGMRKLHLPQSLIIAISVTLRYFPAIMEEVKHIREAMKLQKIPLSRKLECYVVPVMISATSTAEEISAAAVTRGVDNPAKKTSLVDVSFHVTDFLCMVFCAVGVIITLVLV